MLSCVYHVYLITNRRRNALYCGVTERLEWQARQHRAGRTPHLTHSRHLTRVVWSESHEDRTEAENRQNAIRRLTRAQKEALVTASNPEWRDVLVAPRPRNQPVVLPAGARGHFGQWQKDAPLV